MSFAAPAELQRLLKRPHLSDAHPGVVAAALHPQQVRVVTDVTQQGALLSGAVERQGLVVRREVASATRTAGFVVFRAHGAADEGQGLGARRFGRPGHEVGRVEASGAQRVAEKGRVRTRRGVHRGAV